MKARLFRGVIGPRQLLGPAALTALLFVVAPACSDSDDGKGSNGAGGSGGGGECKDGGGPVSGDADAHCNDDSGAPITQEIGMCSTGAQQRIRLLHENPGAGGAAGGEEEESPPRYGRQAYDDDCKYSVSFENSCIQVGIPATLTLTLTRKSDGEPATGGTPDSPEIYLEDEPSHISPSTNIEAPEGPNGVYAIGPVVFDKSGRWVVRFHFFETCSDVPEDSPHGHVAFYIDVP